jgi:hypothetical protein
MNPHYDKQLEVQVDRALKELPELAAPQTLMPRVLQALAARRALPWYRQPFLAWPFALRVATLVILLASLGVFCGACYQLTRAAGYANAMQEIAQTFSGLTSVWNVITALGGAVALVVKHFGTGILIGCCLAAALGYAVCIGLGTACVRLAFATKRVPPL